MNIEQFTQETQYHDMNIEFNKKLAWQILQDIISLIINKLEQNLSYRLNRKSIAILKVFFAIAGDFITLVFYSNIDSYFENRNRNLMLWQDINEMVNHAWQRRIEGDLKKVKIENYSDFCVRRTVMAKTLGYVD